MGDIISSLTAKKLVELQSQMTPCPVDILMPRFNIESETHLNDVLSTMGMPLAFASGAQFSNMVEGDNLYVGLIKQKAKIEVNEKGTKAAAVTVARMLKEEVVVEDHDVKFHANRPFVYVIQEASSGVILFIGKFTGA